MKSHGLAAAAVESRSRPKGAGLRLGVIGLGNIGRQHWRAARACPALDIVAVADSHPDIADEHLEGVAVYARWEELLLHSDLEAVSICVPHHLHAPMTLAALQAGKHVLVEKPLALDCEQGRRLIAAARKRELVLMVEMTHRFYPPVKEARELVEAGRIGRIYAVEDRIIEPISTQLTSWMQRKSLAGGGVGLTNGVHMLDRIAAVTAQPLNFKAGLAGFGAALGDIEDTASLQLSLANGAPVQVLAAWPRRGACPPGGNDIGCDDELTLYGTAATLRVWAWRGWRLEPLDSKIPAQEKLCFPPESDLAARVRIGVRGALEEFAAAVREAREPQPPAREALAAQSLVEEFYAFAGILPAGVDS